MKTIIILLAGIAIGLWVIPEAKTFLGQIYAANYGTNC